MIRVEFPPWRDNEANASSVSSSSERMTKGSRSGEVLTFRRCLECIFILIRRHIWIQGHRKMKKPSSDLSAAANNPGYVCWRNHRGNNQPTKENLKPRRGAKLLPQDISFFHLQPKECLEGSLFIIVIVVMSRFCSRICMPFRYNFSSVSFARTSLFYTYASFFHRKTAKEKTTNSFLCLDKQRFFPWTSTTALKKRTASRFLWPFLKPRNLRRPSWWNQFATRP